MNEIAQRLQQRFEAIHRERMMDMPMVNPALRVAAIGFEKGEHGCLGVLITPWCMNLVLMPEGGEWVALHPGTKQRRTFPSGVYEFVAADEQGVGRYLSCSLFSPMFDFADHDAALSTAKAVMLTVMDEAFVDKRAPGDPLGYEVNETNSENSPQMSRRNFLRGRLSR